MVKADRREEIKTIFRTKGEIKLKELEERFPDCSSMTLRRDIKYLEEQGLVRRTRGGAVAMSNIMLVTEDDYQKRAMYNTKKKIEIAKKAVKIFQRGCSIYVDAGSTMMFLAREIPDEYCSIVTSGVNIAMELMKKSVPIITLIGGELNRNTMTVAGVESAQYISSINIDNDFMATSGFTQNSGMTCGTYTECGIKREVLKRARKKVVMMDSTKYGKNMPVTFANLEDIDIFVTDDDICEEAAKLITDSGAVLL